MIDDLRKRIAASISADEGLALTAHELRTIVRLGFDVWLLSARQAAANLEAERKQAPRDDAPPDRAVYTPAMLADRWGISKAAVVSAIKSGQIVGFRLGKTMYRVRHDEMRRYEDRNG